MKKHDPYGPILKELRTLSDSDDKVTFYESLHKLQPHVSELRKQYQKSPSKVDFSDDETRLAYLLTYYPHYIEQIYRVLENLPEGLLDEYLNRESLRVCFFGPGPAPEALGLAMFLRDRCPLTTQLTGYLLDKYVDAWRLGQELTRYHLAPAYWPKGKLVFKPLLFDFQDTRSLRKRSIDQAIRRSQLLVMQNCLNDQMGNLKYAQVMAQEIFRRAAPSAVFLISDLDFEKVRDVIGKIERVVTAEKLGKVILQVQEEPVDLVSNFVVPQVLREYLFTGEEGKWLTPKKTSKVYFSVLQRM